MALSQNVPLATNPIATDLVAMNANWELTAPGVVTTAGDIVYASAANVIARLAIGTANYKLFTNAAGSAPEWGAGLKIGALSPARELDAASGDVAYTGVGFKPTLVAFFGTINGTTATTYLGITNATNHYCMSRTTGGVHNAVATACIYCEEDTGKVQSAIGNTMDADGFTLTWTRTGATSAGTITLFYIAIR